jgi:hypothetical protein
MEPLLLSAGLAAAVAVAGYLYWRSRAQPPARVYHFRCTHCGQKMRFGAASQGRRVLCPQCLGPCTLPQVEAAPAGDAVSPAPYRVKRV